MTSKLSFFKLLKADIRRRGWLLLLIFFASAILLPVCCQLRLEQTAGTGLINGSKGEMSAWMYQCMENVVIRTLGPSNLIMMVAVLVAAVLCGITGFSYLHSREKVDFYHSLALKRKTLFWIQYLSGGMIAVVPYILCQVVSVFGVGLVNGLLTTAVLTAAFKAMGFFCLCFASAYTLCVLAMLLTGKILTGVLGTLFFWGYGPLCFWLIQRMMCTFFNTYYELPGNLNPGLYGSPVTLMQYMGRGIGHEELIPVHMWLTLLAMLGIGIVLCILAYNKRPSEAAESALSYPKSESVVKVLVSIPGALATGLAVQGVIGYSSRGWFVGIVILAAIFLNCILEFIFNMDLKSIWRHKYSCGVILGGTAVLFMIFILDIFGYDRWQPSMEKVEKMSFFSTQIFVPFEDGYYEYERKEAALLQEGDLEQFMPIYELAQEGMLNTKMENLESAEDIVVVCYWMKDGRKVYRRYYISHRETVDSVIDELSQNQEFRETYYYPSGGKEIAKANRVSVSDWADYRNTEQPLNLSEESLKELAELFHEESMNMTTEEMRDTQPAGLLWIVWDQDERREVYCKESYYLYPQYIKTLEYLRQKGIRFQQQISARDISTFTLEIEGVTNKFVAGNNQITNSYATEIYETYTFSEEEEIKQVMTCIEKCRYSDFKGGQIGGYVTINYKDGTTSGGSCRITDEGRLESFLEDHQR